MTVAALDVEAQMRTLTIDIGGTGIKLLPVDARGDKLAERHRELTPKPSTPKTVLSLIEDMVSKQEPFDRVSVGFPGVVVRGVVHCVLLSSLLDASSWRIRSRTFQGALHRQGERRGTYRHCPS